MPRSKMDGEWSQERKSVRERNGSKGKRTEAKRGKAESPSLPVPERVLI